MGKAKPLGLGSGSTADAIRQRYEGHPWERFYLHCYPEEFFVELPTKEGREEFRRQFPEDYRIIMHFWRESERRRKYAATAVKPEVSRVIGIETRER